MCVVNEGPTPASHSPFGQEVTSAWKVKGHGLKREAPLTSPQFENGHRSDGSHEKTHEHSHTKQPDNLNAPHFTHTRECKPFTSKLHAFAKQNHPPSKVRTSQPELRRLANDRGHVHSYYQNLEKLSAPLFSSIQSDLIRSVKYSVRRSLAICL